MDFLHAKMIVDEFKSKIKRLMSNANFLKSKADIRYFKNIAMEYTGYR